MMFSLPRVLHVSRSVNNVRGMGEGATRRCWVSSVVLVEEALPEYVLVENVPGIVRVPGFSTFRRFLKMLNTNDYKYVCMVLDAKYYGVPQNRRRQVLLASRHRQPPPFEPKYGNQHRPFKTVRQAISHFPAIAAGERHPEAPNHVAASITELNLERLRLTPHDGGDRRSWPDHLRLECHTGNYKGHTDVYGRMRWDKPAPALTGRCISISNGRYGHPEQDRAISLREAAALQSFPDGYVFFGNNTVIARQIGNAVPVRLAEQIRKTYSAIAATPTSMNNPLKPYTACKPSGVSWLGNVPAHWDVLPNRAIFAEVAEQNCPGEQMLSVTITSGVIRQQELLEDTSKKDSSRLDRAAYQLVQSGDIAYNKMRAWQGAIGVSEYRGIVSPAYVVQRPLKGINSRYLHYLLRTPAFAKEAERWSYGITSDMWSLRPEHFKMIYACVPPLPEQTTIVRFLDHADRHIRRYIRAKQKLIALLEEQKQAIIHQAVTGQVDVRTGQPYSAYKPSGVEWLVGRAGALGNAED